MVEQVWQQRWEGLDIVVVDQSEEPQAPTQDGIRYHVDTGCGLPRARNIGLGLATGDAVLFLDDDVHLRRHARQCIQPYDKIVTIIKTNFVSASANKNGIEFEMMKSALSWVDSKNMSFDFILKVRTDNFVKSDIAVSTTYGVHPSFFYRFIEFEYHLGKFLF